MAQQQGEFQFIDKLLKPLARHPGALGLADDAALLACPEGAELVLTNDMLVAGVHFLAEEAPGDIAAKALAVNLSDLAAMGARPVAYLMALSLNADNHGPWLDSFVAGLAEEQARYGLTLIGGDTTATPGPFSVSITAIGQVPKGEALKRDGAKPGDAILVSGTIGDAALGLAAVKGELPGADPELIDRFRRPQPRLALGEALRGLASAVIDVSDGLVADLAHITQASGVRAVIEMSELPLSPAARACLASDAGLMERILSGGDDYELLVTVPPDKLDDVHGKIANVHIPLTLIGHIETGDGVAVIDAEGREMPLTHTGFRHF